MTSKKKKKKLLKIKKLIPIFIKDENNYLYKRLFDFKLLIRKLPKCNNEIINILLHISLCLLYSQLL